MIGWGWLAPVPARPDGAFAAAEIATPDGAPAGWLAAWPAGERPVDEAVQVADSGLDPGAPDGWISLVWISSAAMPLYDDPAVCHAIRRVLRQRAPAAVTTFTRDAVHFAGALTLGRDGSADGLADDPFSAVAPARLLRIGPGLLGPALLPAGPAGQRYAGKPWPAADFRS